MKRWVMRASHIEQVKRDQHMAHTTKKSALIELVRPL
jgi:hypothetical protein